MISEIVTQAKQGNPQAIAALLNRHLRSQGITAKVAKTPQALHILLESAAAPDARGMVAFIQQGMNRLQPVSVHTLLIFGRAIGAEKPVWSRQIRLGAAIRQPKPAAIPRKTYISPHQSVNTASIPRKTQPQPSGKVFVSQHNLRPAYSGGFLLRKSGLTRGIILVGLGVGVTGCMSLLGWAIVNPEFGPGRPNPILSPATSPTPVVAPAPSQLTIDSILNEVRQKHHFSRFMDRWGSGKALFLPVKAWDELTQEKQQTLIEYARAYGYTAIVVGRPIKANKIMFDNIVWTSQ